MKGQHLYGVLPFHLSPSWDNLSRSKTGAPYLKFRPIIGCGIVVNVIVYMAFVNVGTDKKLIFALCPAHSRFIADPVGLLRGYFSRLERLAYLEEQRPSLSLPARFGLVLAMHQQELGMCRSMVAKVRGHSAQLLRVKGIFKPLLHGLDSAFVCRYFVRFDVGCGRRQSSFPKNTAVTVIATAFLLWDNLSQSTI